MKKDDKTLQDTYDDIFAKIIELTAVKKIDAQIVAATLMAHALKIYKTILDKHDYEKMVKTMAEQALIVDMNEHIDKRKLN